MVEELTDANFDEKTKIGNWIVDFGADWCGPCRVIEPKIEQLATDYKGKVDVGKMNVNENQKIAEKFKIMSIPTILFIKDGVVVGIKIGGQYSLEDLKGFIKEFFGV